MNQLEIRRHTDRMIRLLKRVEQRVPRKKEDKTARSKKVFTAER